MAYDVVRPLIHEVFTMVNNAKVKNKKIEGIIVGKAIYDGDIELNELAKEINA